MVLINLEDKQSNYFVLILKIRVNYVSDCG